MPVIKYVYPWCVCYLYFLYKTLVIIQGTQTPIVQALSLHDLSKYRKSPAEMNKAWQIYVQLLMKIPLTALEHTCTSLFYVFIFMFLENKT